MGFFATFWSWLNGEMAVYVGDNTARLASILEPATVTLATIYVMAWGYLHLTGRIDEPFVTGLRRIAVLVLVLGVGLHLWLYNTVIVDTFYHAPSELAGAMVNSTDPVSTIDTIWERGGAVAGALWSKGGFLSNPGFDVAGLMVWALMGLLCVYAMFLIALSSVALSVLLALGPLFVTLLLFDATRRFFAAWLAQLANYAFITILTVMVSALLLQVVQTYAVQTAARGDALVTVDALNMVLIAMLVFLVLRQVMPIASALAGGVSLNSFAVVSRGAVSASRSAGRLAGLGLQSAPFVGRAAASGIQGAGRGLARGVNRLGESWRDFRR